MEIITAGYTAYNGYAFTAADASAYNRACEDTAKSLRAVAAAPSSALCAAAAEFASSNQHRLFVAITQPGVSK